MSLLAMASDAFSADALNEADRQGAARPFSVPLLATRFNVWEIIINIFDVNSNDVSLVFLLQPLFTIRYAWKFSLTPLFLSLSLSLFFLKNLLKLRRYEGVYVNACNPIERCCH